MKFYQILFMNTLILGTLISISAYSWLAMWMGLEVNLLSFIPLISKNNSLSSETAFKYFIVQALSSMMILFSIIMSLNLDSMIFNSWIYLSSSAFLMKMGCAPFHFWFIEIISGLNWVNTMIILTWQKIAPMILLMFTFFSNFYLNFIICVSLFFSSFKSWNQTNLKKILALSSMNHMSWMLSIFLLNHSIWMIYFIFYSFITLTLTLMFKIFNLNFFMQLNNFLILNKNSKLLFFSNFLSLSGLPPFLGFFPKWLVLLSLMNKKFFFLSLMLIFFTLWMIYIYLSMMFNTLTLKISEPLYLFTLINNKILFFLNFFNLTGLMIFSILLVYF
uniref:NADH-ubiquinone oxidoreductase chain 2 n=1 Tax=Cucujoidea sp. 7 KM-2017 TaxID=2219388 RepID=A0A346RH03_9CUCU|nr:NADH dehydrogenase subunit 2 [Cucujoidea sp. 7 KM-2017]